MKKVSLVFVILLMSLTLLFSQDHGTPKVNPIVESYNQLSDVRQSQRNAAFENAKKRRKVIITSSIGVTVIVFAIILMKRKKKGSIDKKNKSTSVLDLYKED